LILLNPGIHVGTKEAYDGVEPRIGSKIIQEVLASPIENWQYELINQFEESIFPNYPLIKHLKEALINLGAVYASMSGSGSSVFGIFDEKPKIIGKELEKYHVFSGFF